MYFFDESFRTFIKVILNFVPKGPIANKSALVQAMAWCQTDEKPLPASDPLHWRIYAPLGDNELPNSSELSVQIGDAHGHRYSLRL